MPETYTIPQAFEKSVLSHPEKVALQVNVDGGYAGCTYGELLAGAKNIAAFLVSQGVQKGDRIAIYSRTCPEWCMAYLGLVMAGAVAVPLDVQLEAEEVKNILTHSQGRVILISEENGDKTLKAAEGLCIRIVNLDSKEFSDICNRSHSPEKFNLPEIDETDIASIVYTSGTTGIPKGVMLSHKNFCFDALSIIEAGLISIDYN